MTTTRCKLESDMKIYTDQGVVPIPEGYTQKRVVEILEKAGHKILSVSEKPKVKKAV